VYYVSVHGHIYMLRTCLQYKHQSLTETTRHAAISQSGSSPTECPQPPPKLRAMCNACVFQHALAFAVLMPWHKSLHELCFPVHSGILCSYGRGGRFMAKILPVTSQDGRQDCTKSIIFPPGFNLMHRGVLIGASSSRKPVVRRPLAICSKSARFRPTLFFFSQWVTPCSSSGCSLGLPYAQVSVVDHKNGWDHGAPGCSFSCMQPSFQFAAPGLTPASLLLFHPADIFSEAIEVS